MEERKQEVCEQGRDVTGDDEFVQLLQNNEQSILFNVASYLPVVILIYI